eukprot:88459_1
MSSVLRCQITYFMIFSIMFYVWCIGMNKQKLIKVGLIRFNIFLLIFLFIYCLLIILLYEYNNIISISGIIIWCILLTILCVSAIIYSIVSNTEKKIVNKSLLFMNCFTALFIIYLSITSVYFSINPIEHMNVISHIILYFAINAIFLIFLSRMYRNYLYKYQPKNDAVTKLQNMMQDNDKVIDNENNNNNNSTCNTTIELSNNIDSNDSCQINGEEITKEIKSEKSKMDEIPSEYYIPPELTDCVSEPTKIMHTLNPQHDENKMSFRNYKSAPTTPA